VITKNSVEVVQTTMEKRHWLPE